jgi:hypothetical protein
MKKFKKIKKYNFGASSVGMGLADKGLGLLSSKLENEELKKSKALNPNDPYNDRLAMGDLQNYQDSEASAMKTRRQMSTQVTSAGLEMAGEIILMSLVIVLIV